MKSLTALFLLTVLFAVKTQAQLKSSTLVDSSGNYIEEIVYNAGSSLFAVLTTCKGDNNCTNLQIYDKSLVRKASLTIPARADWMVFNPASTLLLVGGSGYSSRKGCVYLYDITSIDNIKTISGQVVDDQIEAGAFSPGGEMYAISAAKAKQILVFNTYDQSLSTRIALDAAAPKISFFNNEEILANIGYSQLELINFKKQQSPVRFTAPNDLGINGFYIARQGYRMLVSTMARIYLYDLKQMKDIAYERVGKNRDASYRSTYGKAISPDGNTAVMIYAHKVLVLYNDFKKNREIDFKQRPGMKDSWYRFSNITFSPDNTKVLYSIGNQLYVSDYTDWVPGK
ncbi:WD40 repeat domain-containing protein [Sediminibacterium ginsengisoli]|uniref:WD40-like Beta Propeller Repeat n=1 Tax=Sediminibacterium ginsengisoli TaxID=413434 RepID=A0A1T4KZK1_9BACT|nr:WD40 repeat domain-containing protein [Sediminibacterium ginsengisoli]SJZ47904.1 hypothetical protein SAMN04488132_102216 [Sediminibacterium ginsengisoli]